MSQLQEHQLRVAAVGEMIAQSFKGSVSKHDVTTACLLHDMGNIVKFNLKQTQSLFPEDFEGKDISYWEQVKQEFINKYGTGSHNVTMKIVDELGVGPRIKELVGSVGFSQGIKNAATDDFEKKICSYA